MIEDVIDARAAGRRFTSVGELRVEDAAGLLRRHGPVLAISALLGAAGCYEAAGLIPPSYVASAELYVDPRSIQPLSTPGGQEDSNSEIIFVESQAHIIGSESVLKRVVAAEKLDEDPEFSGSSGDRTALSALADHVTVRRPERTFILDLSVKARTPEKAARLANAVAQAYFDEQAAARIRMARNASQALTDRLDALRDRLREAEQKGDAFRRSHGLVGTRTQLSSEQQLTDANTELGQARSRVVAAQARLDEVKHLASATLPPGASPEAVLSATITLLRGRQADARRRLDKLAGDLGPLHPEVRDARSEVRAADRAVAGELARIAQAARVEFQRATAAEAAQRKIVDDLSERAANVSSAITELGEYDREVEVNKNLLNTFLSRARETSELERLDTPDARLISSAQPPHSRSFPPRGSLFAALGLLFGLAVGLVLAWCREQRRSSLPRPPMAAEDPDQRAPQSDRPRRLADLAPDVPAAVGRRSG